MLAQQLIEVMKMKMHPIQFGLIMNMIQMKSMAIIYTGKTMKSNTDRQLKNRLEWKSKQEQHRKVTRDRDTVSESSDGAEPARRS
jgi:hypothetical protein